MSHKVDGFLIRHADGAYVADRQGLVTHSRAEAWVTDLGTATEVAALWNRAFPEMPVTVVPAEATIH